LALLHDENRANKAQAETEDTSVMLSGIARSEVLED
jgi:hypothetical protein